MEESIFEVSGYFKEYYLNGKFIGFLPSEKDREVFGYMGRKTEMITVPLTFKNKKRLKIGDQVITELHMICGRMKD